VLYFDENIHAIIALLAQILKRMSFNLVDI
jgi:hypothetical protein